MKYFLSGGSPAPLTPKLAPRLGCLSLLVCGMALLNACQPQTQTPGCAAFFAAAGQPQGKNVRLLCHKRMTVGFDAQTLTAAYVAEHLTREQMNGDAERENIPFRPDPLLAPNLQVPTQLYSRSGYDRGHLAAAGNFKGDLEAMTESFYTSNVAPQNPELNRGLWSSLEQATRGCAEALGSVYILTGVTHPASKRYLQRDELRLSIPNTFWKLIVSGKNYRAFIVSNEKPVKETFVSYEVSLADLEALTKLNLLPQVEFGDNTRNNNGTLCMAQFGRTRK